MRPTAAQNKTTYYDMLTNNL